MAEMKTFNGYEVVDAKAREDIATLKEKEPDLSGYATEKYVDEAISNAAIGDVDLSNYYTKQEINTELSQILATLTQHNSSIQALEEAFDNIATAEGGSY